MAFDVTRKEIERFIHELPIGEKGEVLLLTDQNVIVRFSLALDGFFETTPSDLPAEPVRRALVVCHELGTHGRKNHWDGPRFTRK
jgi:hypothetical protein